ncbi:exported hypothetical protein [Candidatus Zixiibacteriota bacterium]|nr:exported hypothetical protein [candidate division Zixibacteria bacterium]
MRKVIVLFVLTVIAASLKATSPSVPQRNVEIETQLIGTPTKVGDIFQVNWSFVVHKDTNEPPRIQKILDSAAVKAYLFCDPLQQYVSGDSVWWGKLQYDVRYNLSATYKIITPRPTILAGVVESHMALYDEGDLLSINEGKGQGIKFPIVKRQPKVYLEIRGKDTIRVSNDFVPPREDLKIVTVGRVSRRERSE